MTAFQMTQKTSLISFKSKLRRTHLIAMAKGLGNGLPKFSRLNLRLHRRAKFASFSLPVVHCHPSVKIKQKHRQWAGPTRKIAFNSVNSLRPTLNANYPKNYWFFEHSKCILENELDCPFEERPSLFFIVLTPRLQFMSWNCIIKLWKGDLFEKNTLEMYFRSTSSMINFIF